MIRRAMRHYGPALLQAVPADDNPDGLVVASSLTKATATKAPPAGADRVLRKIVRLRQRLTLE